MANVLLADDDPAMRDLASRALGTEGHTVVVVHDGQEALERATGANPPFDILVTDPAEIAARRDHVGSILYWPLREGKSVYPRAATYAG